MKGIIFTMLGWTATNMPAHLYYKLRSNGSVTKASELDGRLLLEYKVCTAPPLLH